jgi:predicted acylesterase/phospholipase RssA
MMLKVAKERGADVIIYSDVSVFGVVYRRPSLNFLLHVLLRFFSAEQVEEREEEKKYGFFSLARRVFRTVKKYKRQCEVCRKTLVDFVIEPSLKKMRPLDFHKDKEAFSSGREAGCAQIEKILSALHQS